MDQTQFTEFLKSDSKFVMSDLKKTPCMKFRNQIFLYICTSCEFLKTKVVLVETTKPQNFKRVFIKMLFLNTLHITTKNTL